MAREHLCTTSSFNGRVKKKMRDRALYSTKQGFIVRKKTCVNIALHYATMIYDIAKLMNVFVKLFMTVS